MNILTVDDEENALRDLAHVINKIVPDPVIETSDEAEQALTVFRERAFDVAFLDINMPVGDGLSIAKEMK